MHTIATQSWLQTTGLPRYRYEPFVTARAEIRLCRVLFDSERGGHYLSLDITYSTLAPPYRALSYTWGTSEGAQTIPIMQKDGKMGLLDVHKNLADFLEVYKGLGEYYIWVDQLCIDQSSVQEKSWQVQQMSSIYGRADEVVAWLGVDPWNGCAFNWMDDWVQYNPISSEEGPVTEAPQQEDGLDWSKMLSSNYADMKALDAFVNNGYWERLWIVQELLLARKVMVVYGQFNMKWEHVARFRCRFSSLDWSRLDKSGALGRLLDYAIIRCQPHTSMTPFPWQIANLLGHHSQDPDAGNPVAHTHSSQPFEGYCEIAHVDEFCGVIQAFSRNKCTDLHDRVYGFIGLYEEAGYRWKKGVNYEKPIKELFIDTATALLETKEVNAVQALEVIAEALSMHVIGDWRPTVAKWQRLRSMQQGIKEVTSGNRLDRSLSDFQEMQDFLSAMRAALYDDHYGSQSEWKLRDMLHMHLSSHAETTGICSVQEEPTGS